MEPDIPERVLAVDPGRSKWGLAVVCRDGRCLERQQVLRAQGVEAADRLLRLHGVSRVLVGGRTGGAEALGLLSKLPSVSAAQAVDEHGSTLAARSLYYRYHPPRGWRRLVPRGLLVPPRALDDYAAEVLARRFYGLPPC